MAEKEKEGITIKTKNQAGEEIEILVIKPTHRIAQEANMQYNTKVASFIRLAKKGEDRPLLRSEVEDYLIKNGIWTNEDASQMEKIGLRIRACETLLKKGGIKLSEGRRLAIEMGELRNQMIALYNKRQQLDSCTIESMSENHKFNYLASKCILDKETQSPYFSDLEDYINKQDEQAAIDGAKTLAKMLYGFEDDFRNTLYEVQWMKKYGFSDDSGRYVDKKGGYVDKDGKKVDEQGRYIDDEGNLVDRHGNKVNEHGDLLVDKTEPFIDDETGESVIRE